jgi:tetratricopeptide (TPR) repeat protein
MAAGEDVWWDQNIKPGQDWKFEIRQAMKIAYAVLLCLSRESGARETSGIYPEAMDAINLYREYAPGTIFLIPVRFSDCEIPSIEIDGTRTLDRLQYQDLFPSSKYAAGVRNLLEAIRETPHHPWQGQSQTALTKPRALYLPLKPANFVGRDSYFGQLRGALLAQSGMFLLSGQPGSGKSTLALMFAWQVQQEFEAVIYQTCGPRSVELIVSELADTLKEQISEQVTQLPPEQKVRAVKNWLQQRRALLLLDDVWLSDTTAGRQEGTLQLQDLLPGPPVSVLFTSRRPTLPWADAEHRSAVDAFTAAEAEEAFRSYLGAVTVERYREQLLQFAEKVERLPLAVAAAAQLLQNEFGPLEEAARGLKLEQLRTEIHDVPGLLQRAIEAQGREERRLLLAAAVCAPEGFWLPLALSIAGLNSSQGAQARNHLANAALLRVVDQGRERFEIHALLREQLHSDREVEDFRVGHAWALEKLFEKWESRWKDCRECLSEIIRASEFLWSEDRIRQKRLTSWGYACARRIGELGIALHIEQQNEQLWSNVQGDQSKDGLQRSYGNQALILIAWGRLKEAMTLVKKQEAICKELGNDDGLQNSYGNQMLILNAWGRLKEAMTLLTKQEAICKKMDIKDGLQRSYGNQAWILQAWGRPKEAMALAKKQEAICNELDTKDGLQHSYGTQAWILQAWGRLKEAMALVKKQEAICEELGIKDGLHRSYGTQALILQAWGHLDEAMALLKKQEEICEELGYKDGLQLSYGNQAVILQAWGRLKEALVLLKKKEEICKELGNKNSLAASYANEALILMEWGRLEKAMALLKKEEAICKQLGNKDGLSRSYRNQALILKDRGRLEEAMSLLKKQEVICEELGNKDGLQISYGYRASILYEWGRLKGALALRKKEEALCKALGNKSSLAYCYWHWGVLAREMNNHEAAQGKFQAALGIFTELKMPSERDAVQAELNDGQAKAAAV